jgi:hypothetical protein
MLPQAALVTQSPLGDGVSEASLGLNFKVSAGGYGAGRDRCIESTRADHDTNIPIADQGWRRTTLASTCTLVKSSASRVSWAAASRSSLERFTSTRHDTLMWACCSPVVSTLGREFDLRLRARG